MNVSSPAAQNFNFDLFKNALQDIKADAKDIGKAQSVMQSLTKELKDVFQKIEKLEDIQGGASDSVKAMIEGAKAKAMNAVAQALSEVQANKPQPPNGEMQSAPMSPLASSSADRSLGNDPLDVARPMTGQMRSANPGQFGAGSLPSLLGGKSGGGMFFEDILAAFMMKMISNMEQEVEQSIRQMESGPANGSGSTGATTGGNGTGSTGGTTGQAAGGTGSTAGGEGPDSRQLQFEKIKQEMNKISQMMQTLSNVLSTMHQSAMGAIRNIK